MGQANGEGGADLSRAPLTVMFVRHGEKPSDHGVPHGINHHGEQDAHSLSVRGWTRAGALAGLFAHAPVPAYPDVVVPERIIATRPSHEAKSRREYDTADPLARRIRVVIDDSHEHGNEDALRESILSDPSATLVVWHHGTLSTLVRGFPVSNAAEIPDDWPGKRFDLIWVLVRAPGDAAYAFRSLDQRLLEGDAGVD